MPTAAVASAGAAHRKHKWDRRNCCVQFRAEPSKIPHWRCSAQPSPEGICIHLRQPLGIGPGHVFAHVSQGATLCALRGMDRSSRLPRAVGWGILDELAREKEMLPPWSGWKLLLTKSPIHGKTNCGNSAFCQ